MSKSFNSRNKQLNDVLRNCKGGAQEPKVGHKTKRAIQHDEFRKQMKNNRWDD